MGMTGYILFIFDALMNMRIMKEWGWMARSFIFHFWCIPRVWREVKAAGEVRAQRARYPFILSFSLVQVKMPWEK